MPDPRKLISWDNLGDKNGTKYGSTIYVIVEIWLFYSSVFPQLNGLL
nr:MAG TPA: hypothetical protein [Caudoviricetes sp.]